MTDKHIRKKKNNYNVRNFVAVGDPFPGTKNVLGVG